jgi:predicted DNA repair protein MutK
MAVGGLMSVFKNVATLMDDIALAAKKTAGVLGDDIAVNAEGVGGFKASRELPVIWAIAKGSAVNKIIILPIIFLLTAFLPKIIIPILLIGGVYLCFEGGEKISEWIFGEHEEAEVVVSEEEKIKSAIKTDFVLSVEIIVIALGAVMSRPLSSQIMTVSIVAFITVVGVYGLLALIIRMDDFGIRLVESAGNKTTFSAKSKRAVGNVLIKTLPIIVHGLEYLGTIAMLLVGGGIFRHNIKTIHHATDFMYSFIADLVVGLLVGVIAVLTMMVIKKVVKLVK